MCIYITGTAAIEGLLKKGYTSHLKLSGNDLLWIKEKSTTRTGEFYIREYYHFLKRDGSKTGLIIFAVAAIFHDAKGILITHYRDYLQDTSPILIKKIMELYSDSRQEKV